jgi:putative ABC transport system permease protein
VSQLEETVDGMISEERLLAILSTAFGGLAVLLAAIGLYGVMAYNMSRRRAEIGVRVALGATTRDIGRAVAAECLKLVAGGLLAGTLATLALTQLVRSMMFGLSASDPLAIAGSVCLLVAVAAIAAAVPAWRASHLDPIAALRYE